MKYSTIEKMIETVLKPRNHIDGLWGDSKSLLRLQNYWKGLPEETHFFVAFFKYKRKAIGNILEMSQKLIQITKYSKKFY
jgi:hypothetical protein